MTSRDSNDSPSSSCGMNSVLLKSMLFSQVDHVPAERHAPPGGRRRFRLDDTVPLQPSRSPWSNYCGALARRV